MLELVLNKFILFKSVKKKTYEGESKAFGNVRHIR